MVTLIRHRLRKLVKMWKTLLTYLLKEVIQDVLAAELPKLQAKVEAK